MSKPILFCPSCNSQNINSYGKCWKCKDCGRYWSKNPKGRRAWNKGLTKENDTRVKEYSDKQSQTKRSNPEFISKATENLPEPKLVISKEEFIKLYESMNQKDIATKLNVSQSAISLFMKRNNIDARSTGEGGAISRRNKQEEINKKISQSLKGNTNWRFSHKYPNSEEEKLIYFFNKWSLPFKYVGDGSFKINDKCPDFIYEDKKLIIEFFGELWHEESDEPDRIIFFQKQGWKCLIIWGKEIRGNKIGKYHKGDYKWERPLYDKIIRWLAGLN